MGVLATTAAKALAWLKLQRGAPARGLFLVFGLCSLMWALIYGPDMRALICGP